MPDPAASETAFFRKVQHASTFVLVSEAEARPRAVAGAIVLGVARARGIPARMPCCIDHGLVPADATIVMMDLALSTWGGAVRAAGNRTLFRGPAAQDFWSLAAHVDAFGDQAISRWRSAETVARYRAIADWWALHRPDWGGQGGIPVTSTVKALVYVLTLLLSDEEGLRAYAASNGGRVEVLRQDRQALLKKEDAGADVFFIDDVLEQKVAAGHGTGIFRRLG